MVTRVLSAMFLAAVFSAIPTPIVPDAHAETSAKCPGEEGYYYTNFRRRNPQAGGFVAYTATIEESDSLIINRSAAVCGNAIVTDSVTISGNAIVRGDARISDSATITGDVVVEGFAVVAGKSIIRGRGAIRSGNFVDKTITLGGESTTGTPAPKDPHMVYKKLADHVSKNAESLRPESGSFYTGHELLRQKLSYDGTPCQLVITKERLSQNGRDSSFFGWSETKVDMAHATRIITKDYSPTMAASNIQIPGWSNKPTRRYSYRRGDKVENATTVNRYHTINGDTAESIELPNIDHARIVSGYLTDLMNACKK